MTKRITMFLTLFLFLFVGSAYAASLTTFARYTIHESDNHSPVIAADETSDSAVEGSITSHVENLYYGVSSHGTSNVNGNLHVDANRTNGVGVYGTTMAQAKWENTFIVEEAGNYFWDVTISGFMGIDYLASDNNYAWAGTFYDLYVRLDDVDIWRPVGGATGEPDGDFGYYSNGPNDFGVDPTNEGDGIRHFTWDNYNTQLDLGYYAVGDEIKIGCFMINHAWSYGVAGTSADIHFNMSGSLDYTPVPVPATILLLGSGLVGLVGFRRKTIKKA